MEKSMVIKIRDAIKGGKNIPLRIITTDNIACIDESNAFTAVKWDDTNGILYVYRLQSPYVMESNTNRDQCISLFATDYSNITAMEVARLNIDDIESTVNTIKATGASFSDDFKKWIITMFKEALHKDRWRLSQQDINNIHGAEFEKAHYDYYKGKYPEKMKETIRYADRNEKIAKGELKTDEERANDEP